MIAPLRLTGLAGRLGPGGGPPGEPPGGGPPGGPPGGGGGPPGGPPIEGAIGAAPGDAGAATPLVFMAFKSFVIVLILDCKFEICDVKSLIDESTRSGIRIIIVIIFSIISPNVFTFSSIGDFFALSRKLVNSSAMFNHQSF